MKKRTVSILLAGILAMSVFAGGCGKKDSGNKPEDTGEKLSVRTGQDASEDTPDYLAPGVEFPEDGENMVPVFQSLMASAYGEEDAEYYDQGDAELDGEYFWESIRYLVSISQTDAKDSGGGELEVDKDDVVTYARTLFGNYDIDAEGIPQIPDSCREFVNFRGYNGVYTFTLLSTDDVQPYITVCDEGDTDGSWKLQAELREVQDDESAASYGFIMEEQLSEDSRFAYKITSCVNLSEDDSDALDADEQDTDVEDPDAEDPDQTDADDTNTDPSDSDDPDETNANPSDSGQNNSGQNDNNQNTDDQNNNSSAQISQSTAQSKAQSYMNERVSDDGSSYSMSYSGTKNFDGQDYYSYSVTKKDSDGKSSYVTNIYVDAATGDDVWDEAN